MGNSTRPNSSSDKSTLKRNIVKLIREKFCGISTTSEVADELEMSWNTAEKYLLELAIDRKVQRLKKKGVNLWVLRREVERDG